MSNTTAKRPKRSIFIDPLKNLFSSQKENRGNDTKVQTVGSTLAVKDTGNAPLTSTYEPSGGVTSLSVRNSSVTMNSPTKLPTVGFGSAQPAATGVNALIAPPSGTSPNTTSSAVAIQASAETSTPLRSTSPSPSVCRGSRATGKISSAITAKNQSFVTGLSMVSSNMSLPAFDTDGKLLKRLALEKLEGKHHVQLEFLATSSEVKTSLTEAIAEVEKKRDEYKKDGLAMRKNEQVMKLGEKTDSVLVWLDKIKDAGDVVAGADPIHIGLPWAGVRILLVGIMAARQQSIALLEGMDAVVYISNQLKVYVDYFHMIDQASDAKIRFQDSLVELYFTIFKFLAKALKRYNNNRAKNLWNAFWSQKNVDWFSQSCQTHNEAIKEAAAQCAREQGDKHHKVLMTKLEEFDGIKKHLQQLEIKVLQIWNNSEKDHKGSVLKWISEILPEDHHNSALQGHVAGTGDWIFEEQIYQDWNKKAASTTLWLAGNVGVGKTKLTAHVIESFRNEPSLGLSKGLAYFYFQQDDSNRRHPANALRSFLKQLILYSGHLQSSIDEEYKNKQGSGHLTENQVQEFLCTTIQGYDEVTVVIDALDECEENEQIQLIRTLRKVIAACPQLRVFISGRQYVGIKSLLRDCATIVLDEKRNHGDIHTFILKKLEECQNDRKEVDLPPISVSMEICIVDKLIEGHSGMFQWVSLHLTQLFSLETDSEIEEVLGEIPEGLTATYNIIWERMKKGPEGTFQRAQLAIQWVYSAARPLDRFELPIAVSRGANPMSRQCDIDFKSISRSCPGLLETNPNGEVHFTHLSVREYFETNHASLISDGIVLTATTCFRTLLDEGIWMLSRSAHGHVIQRDKVLAVFDQYVSQRWVDHSRAVEELEEGISDQKALIIEFKRLQLQFLGHDIYSPSPTFWSWVQYHFGEATFEVWTAPIPMAFARSREPLEFHHLLASLNQRAQLSLALKLACSFFQLRDSNWLRWPCKPEIVFSKAQIKNNRILLGDPQITIHSMPPIAFKPCTPFFAFGIILEEIALRRTLRDIPQDSQFLRDNNTEDHFIDLATAMACLEKVEWELGQQYAGVTGWCLRGGTGDTEPSDSVWRREFWCKVVLPLAEHLARNFPSVLRK